MSEINQIERAFDLFEGGRYREAFSEFVQVYNQLNTLDERKDIYQILWTAYYEPNEAELRSNYVHNWKLLKAYPYFWGKQFCSFEDLPFCLFPVEDNIFRRYDRENDKFLEEYEVNSKDQMRYFFENLDGPLQVKDEDNFYNLTYLNDNVRASEDFAGDNHIYLMYSSWEPLLRLMLTCDLTALLQAQKFVFLVEEKNWRRYPINFQKKFNIDYTKMRPSPVRIEEVKRICFWYKHAHSGSGLSIRVIGALDEVQFFSGYSFNTFSAIGSRLLYFSAEFRNAVSDVNRSYTVKQLTEFISSGQYKIPLDGQDDTTTWRTFLDWLKQTRPNSLQYTVKELFCGYFLFLYEKRKKNPRIVPVMLYEPHMWDPSPYNDLVLSFPYHTVLTCMREPIMTFARCNIIGIVGWDEFSTKYMLASDYAHAQFLHPDLLQCYYGYRFEDLKTKPEVVCRAVCKNLNIPFHAKMLEVEAPADNSGHDVRGFDPAPLHWDVSAVLSEFDMVRLKMFYEPIHRYYGYPTFSFQEHPISDRCVLELFKIPFRFEYTNSKIYGSAAPDRDTFHAWIQSILQTAWRKPFTSPMLLPLEEEKG